MIFVMKYLEKIYLKSHRTDSPEKDFVKRSEQKRTDLKYFIASSSSEQFLESLTKYSVA